jgi:hypothetical protein
MKNKAINQSKAKVPKASNPYEATLNILHDHLQKENDQRQSRLSAATTSDAATSQLLPAVERNKTVGG